MPLDCHPHSDLWMRFLSRLCQVLRVSRSAELKLNLDNLTFELKGVVVAKWMGVHM